MTIPNSVTSIGKNAFYNTSWFKNYPDDFVIGGKVLIKYKGDAKSVTIPESVTNIGYNAFSGCSSLTSVTYHGVTFNLNETEGVSIDEVLSMLDKKDYAVKMSHPVKYSVIWGVFCANPDDVETFAYVKKNFAKMFRFLIGKEDTETIQKVLDTGKLITKKNIDKNIQYAIDNKKYQAQVMLMDYKTKNNWYDDQETIIKKKFSL